MGRSRRSINEVNRGGQSRSSVKADSQGDQSRRSVTAVNQGGSIKGGQSRRTVNGEQTVVSYDSIIAQNEVQHAWIGSKANTSPAIHRSVAEVGLS